uniref:Uncharacterized protein n=1 Tax=Solanum tuberosum TaxID=4113 RepID=M1AKL4_SOLTU
MDSSSEINNCREIIPYVSPVNIVRIAAQENQRVDISESVLLPSSVSNHPRENVSGTPNEYELTLHQLTWRKRGLINAEVIAISTVSFAIVPLASETNIYTVKLNKGEDLVDPFRLNQKYHDIFNDWTCEKKRRPNGQCDKIYLRWSREYGSRNRFRNQYGKECSGPSKFNKLSSPNVSIDVLHLMSPLFQEVDNTSFTNLELQNIVPEDKVHREINDHVIVTLAKNEELTISFSYNEENMEQVPISQSLEMENNENAHMEKGLPYEDNYGEKEMIVNLTNNVKFVTAADSTLDTGENDKEGVCITTNFALPEIAPTMKIDSAKEGDKNTLEDSHGKEDHLISHDNIFTNMDNFDLFSPKEGLDDPFLLYGIENDDFEDAYTPNIKDM